LIRVVVVAPVRLYRELLVLALDGSAQLEVVGAAASASEAIAVLERRGPDTLILDVAVAGPEFVRELTAHSPDLRVIVTAVAETPPNIVEFAEAGAVGFVTDRGTVGDLVAAVVGAAHDELVCSPFAATALLHCVQTRPPASGDAGLSPRELEIAQLIERGLMNKEIAARLGIELPTVKNHVHRILEKLGAHRRAEAGAHIRRVGLVLRD
jgi:DNA-binding NarL/FixJ family response regulator